MNCELHLQIAGVLLLALAVMNLFVPRRFNWRQEMASLSLLNRQIFEVHSYFIILILVMFAGLSFFLAADLLQPARLPRAILTALAVFWLIRLAVQWLYYDRRLWRGHRFNTIMHFVFTGLWCYFVFVYAGALWANVAAGR